MAPPRKKIPEELVSCERDLQIETEKMKLKEKERVYEWIENTDNIDFWKFRTKCYFVVYWFFIYMDNSKWDSLAFELGLNGDEIMWCKNNHKNGPTEEMFLLMMRKEGFRELSLGKVLQALKHLNLTAILSRVHWEEGIASYTASEQTNVDVIEWDSSKINGYNCAPKSFSLHIHQRPEVLVNAENLQDDKTMKAVCSPIKITEKSRKLATLILFFASDAKNEAMEAARQLTAIEKDGKKIGIMHLTPPMNEKMANELQYDPCNSIHKWFKQVDFVVPFLSPQLLRQVQDLDADPSTVKEKQYNRFLYRLTLDDFVSNMSKNYKCRPMCSSDYSVKVQNSEVVKGNGLLQINWSRDQINQFWDIIVSGAREKRKRLKHRASLM